MSKFDNDEIELDDFCDEIIFTLEDDEKRRFLKENFEKIKEVILKGYTEENLVKELLDSIPIPNFKAHV